jgi:hypothetical protein
VNREEQEKKSLSLSILVGRVCSAALSQNKLKLLDGGEVEFCVNGGESVRGEGWIVEVIVGFLGVEITCMRQVTVR